MIGRHPGRFSPRSVVHQGGLRVSIQPKEVTVVSWPAPESVLVIVGLRDGDQVLTKAEVRVRRL